MTILSVLQDAATVIGLSVPSSVFGSSEREHVEMAALANEMAQRIAFDTADWTKLKTLGTLTGDGSDTTFDLPADYQRMLKTTTLWPSATPYSPLTHYADTDSWLAWEVQGYSPVGGGWTLIGDQIVIKPAMANAATAKFYYLSNLIVRPAAGSDKTAFTIDTDGFRLNERTLKLGIIWQWKANKGRPYAEEMANYETALSFDIAADKGSNILQFGRGREPRADAFAFPGTLGP